MRSFKKPGKRRKIVIITGLYAFLAFIISVSILFYLNNFYFNDNIIPNTTMIPSATNGDTVSKTTETNITKKSKINAYTISDIPKEVSNISISYDNQYCMYLYNGIIYIKDIQTNKIKSKITDSSQIANAILLDDRNMILYFTIDRKTALNSDKINIRTYNIDNNVSMFQQSFSITATSNIKKVEYSSLTNLIVINTERNSNNQITDKVYYINIMKRVKLLASEKIVDNMVLLHKSLSLYYQNNGGALFCNSKKIAGFENEKIKLLGCDVNDNIYVQSMTQKNNFYVLNNNKIMNTIKLKDSDYTKILYNGSAIYVVYRNYVINLVNDTNKKITYDKNTSFMNIVDKRIYVRNNNEIKTEEISGNS